MLKVGLTGGIGSGKSLVCEVFKSLGIPVFNADTEAKNILNTNSDVVAEIQKEFGHEIYTSAGVDRKKLASIIFNNTESLAKINSIIHPKVHQNFNSWLMQFSNTPYVIEEAAILFESNAYKAMDFTINVHANELLRIERVVKRDGISVENVKERIKYQLSDEERIQRAVFTIYNEEEQMVIPQILEIHNKIINSKK